MKIKFYLTSSGRSPVEEFFNTISEQAKKDFLDALSLLEAGKTLMMPLSRQLSNIHGGLHELRLRDHSGQIRVFYYIKKDDAIYMLHATRKKKQRIPKKDMCLILRRLKEV